MNTIIGELGKSEKFKDLIKQIENRTSPIVLSGLTGVGMIQLGVAINSFSKNNLIIF